MEKFPCDKKTKFGICLTFAIERLFYYLLLLKKEKRKKGTLNFQTYLLLFVLLSFREKEISTRCWNTRWEWGAGVRWIIESTEAPWEAPPPRVRRERLIWSGEELKAYWVSVERNKLVAAAESRSACRPSVSWEIPGRDRSLLLPPLEIPSRESSNSNGRARREWIICVNSTNYRLVIVHAQRWIHTWCFARG